MFDEPLFVAASKTGRNIRLTAWVWRKIQGDHPEFSDRNDFIDEIRKAIVDPDYIIPGRRGAQIALSWSETAPARANHIAVVYRELNGDGFIITSFFISRFQRLLRRGILWQKSS